MTSQPFLDAAGALARARSRLAYLAADPKRNAGNAVKVMLKFLLLERQTIPVADVPALLQAIPVVNDACARLLCTGTVELAPWAVAALVRAGAAREQDGWLVNAD